MRIKIVHKLLFFIILITIIPLILAGIQMIKISQKAQKTNIYEIHTNRATETSEIISNQIQNWIETLLIISYTQDEQKLSRKGKLNLLSALVEETNDFVVLRLYDHTLTEENSITAIKEENLDEMMEYPDPYIKLLKAHQSVLDSVIENDQIYISPVLPIPELGKCFITIAVYTQISETRRGALVAKVKLDYIQDIIESRSKWEDAWSEVEDSKSQKLVYILDETGRIIAHPERKLALQNKTVNNPDILNIIRHGNEFRSNVTQEFTKNGKIKLLGTGVPIENTSWTVFTETPTKYAYLPAEKMQDRLLFWLVVGFVGAIVESILLAQFINRPIQKFATAAKRVSEGIFTQTVDVHSKDELGDLANVFNTMIHKLQVYDEINVNKLISEQSKIKAIIRNIADGVIATDNNKRILFVNNQFEKWFTVENSEVKGHKLDEYIHHQKLNFLVSKTLKNKEAINSEIKINAPLYSSKESTIKKILKLTSSLVIDGKNNYIGTVTTLRDITKEKEIAQMKSQLMSVVSHELRTPLTSIQGFTQLVMDMGENLSGNIKEFLEIILNESDRLLHIINDFLDLSKIESGRIELKKGPFNLTGTIKTTIFSLDSQVKEKNMDIIQNFPSNTENTIAYGDMNLINQVLVNIIGNAIKYSEPESRVWIDLEETDNKYWVTIKDEGYGIPQNELDKIFEKFYRSRTEETDHITGTGLGLSIVKEIIEKHEEEIFVESEEDKGSTFRFSLDKYDETKKDEE